MLSESEKSIYSKVYCKCDILFFEISSQIYLGIFSFFIQLL